MKQSHKGHLHCLKDVLSPLHAIQRFSRVYLESVLSRGLARTVSTTVPVEYRVFILSIPRLVVPALCLYLSHEKSHKSPTRSGSPFIPAPDASGVPSHHGVGILAIEAKINFLL